MDEIVVAGHILAFDGRVLELFGQLAPGSAGSQRWHVQDLAVSVDGPDRKGRRQVQFKLASSNIGRARLEVDEGEWTTLAPFLERLQGAPSG